MSMCSRDLGADMAFAWPTAEIAIMGAEGAVRVFYRKELEEAEDKTAAKEKRVKEYGELFYHAYIAASRGYIDAVIPPRETHQKFISPFGAPSQKKAQDQTSEETREYSIVKKELLWRSGPQFRI